MSRGRTARPGFQPARLHRLMLEALEAAEASWVFACPPPTPRAMSAADLAEAAIEVEADPERVEVTATVHEAVARALAVIPDKPREAWRIPGSIVQRHEPRDNAL